MYDALQANWGEHPSRTVDRSRLVHPAEWERVLRCENMGWGKLREDERTYIDSCFAGKTLQQVLEGVTFDFVIDGVSRAFTHQNVRTRLGAGFMQHGGRDNDWRHRAWTMPETMRRMCVVQGKEMETQGDDLKHCITDWEPIEEYLDSFPVPHSMNIREAIEEHIDNGRRLYAALVDAGIPWQDARRVLFMGMQTYIHDQYNYLALSGVLANRLEHIMDWEFNCVAQLMLREVRMKCPPMFSKYLGSHSDKAKSAKFAGLESWPPDGKYPNPYERCKTCDHTYGHHMVDKCAFGSPDPVDGKMFYCQCTEYIPHDTLPRQHRPEQMPFFVLHPESMAGGPVRWIPTNGTYPHDKVKP